MIMNQILMRGNEYWDMAQSLDQTQIPDTLTALIQNRLQQLHMSTQEQEILQIMTLLGRPISWEEENPFAADM